MSWGTLVNKFFFGRKSTIGSKYIIVIRIQSKFQQVGLLKSIFDYCSPLFHSVKEVIIPGNLNINKLIWKTGPLTEVQIFIWLVIHGKINISDKLQRTKPYGFLWARLTEAFGLM